ncbi:hypothetical protein TNCV_2669121 [Trichonephila clavipes]|nr:hypothetical protein TNCV_2669121 [Trichonephila clavipes]
MNVTRLLDSIPKEDFLQSFQDLYSRFQGCIVMGGDYFKGQVSAADKGWWVYPLDPHPDAVSLYSGCTLGKRRAWYLPDDRHTAFLVGLRGGWKYARMKLFFTLIDPMLLCPGKDLVLPNLSIDDIARNSRFLILSLPNNGMMKRLPFAILKALVGIGGEPKSVKRLRSGDLLIEISSALQTKSFFSSQIFS